MPRRRSKVGGKRKGAGRPPLGPDARNVTWTIKVTQTMADAINGLARTSNTTRAAVLLEALELAIARGSTR